MPLSLLPGQLLTRLPFNGDCSSPNELKKRLLDHGIA